MANKIICDITGKEMAATDVDFAGHSKNKVALPAVEGRPNLSVVFGFEKRGQFLGDDLHISREGAETLLLAAIDALPDGAPKAKINGIPATISAPASDTTTATSVPASEEAGKTKKVFTRE